MGTEPENLTDIGAKLAYVSSGLAGTGEENCSAVDFVNVELVDESFSGFPFHRSPERGFLVILTNKFLKHLANPIFRGIGMKLHHAHVLLPRVEEALDNFRSVF